MACPRKDPIKRLSFDVLRHEAEKILKRYKKDCKILTLIDTVRRYETAPGFVTKHLADGSELVLRRPDGKEEKIHLL